MSGSLKLYGCSRQVKTPAPVKDQKKLKQLLFHLSAVALCWVEEGRRRPKKERRKQGEVEESEEPPEKEPSRQLACGKKRCGFTNDSE